MKRRKAAGICIAIALLVAALWTGTIFAAGGDAFAGEGEVPGAGWEEEYTDTDTRRGTLSIRCQTFQGFHGIVELCIRMMDGGGEKRVTLTEDGGYALNLSLPEGLYQITAAEAQTDGRQYGSQIRETQFGVLTGKIVMCQVSITPDSVYQFPYEESDREDTISENIDGVRENALGAEEETPVLASEAEPVGKFPNLFAAAGVLVLAGCLFGIFLMRRQKNEGG